MRRKMSQGPPNNIRPYLAATHPFLQTSASLGEPGTNRKRWRAEAALLFVVTVWGVNYPLLKSVFEVMHPHMINSFRFPVSILVLGGVYMYRRRKQGLSVWEPLRKHPLRIAGLGMVGFVAYQFLFIHGIYRTTAGNAALIMTSVPLWAACMIAALGMERIRGRTWFALFFVLGGAMTVVVGGGGAISFDSGIFVGNALMLCAACSWGCYTALNKPMLRHVSATGLTFLALLFALPVLIGAGLPEISRTDWSAVTLKHWGIIVFSGGLSTGLVLALWNNAVNHVGASHTAAYGNLVPLTALTASYLLLGETVNPIQVAGGAAVIGGLLILRRIRRKSPPA